MAVVPVGGVRARGVTIRAGIHAAFNGPGRIQLDHPRDPGATPVLRGVRPAAGCDPIGIASTACLAGTASGPEGRAVMERGDGGPGERLPFERGFHVSWDQLHRDARALAWRLERAAPAGTGGWRAAVAVTRGGMVPACIVARELGIRTVDTVSVSSYDHQSQRAARILKAPDPAVTGDGTDVLVIDDLADTGATFDLVRGLLPRAHFATVYVKPAGRALVDTFVTGVSQDTWIYFPWDMALLYVAPMKGPP
jgi:xanthine phosphoribosyltransferase